MRAVCWNGSRQIATETVPDPVLVNPRDAIVRVTLSGICGSDVHLYNGDVPGVEKGDILGHEFCGTVVAVGPGVRNLTPGERVVVPSVISCGNCFYCRRDEWALCDNSNPNAWLAERVFGLSSAGLFGYSHLFGGYAGSHAEYVRVPFADVGPARIPDGVSDEQAVLTSDAFPTGMMAAEFCNIQPGDVIAVWGAGAVGQCVMMSALLLGAERVIAIDRVPSRLAAAAEHLQAETLNLEETDVVEALRDLTGGRGPDACVDAVGMEAHGFGLEDAYCRIKHAFTPGSDRPALLRQAILSCRKGGVLVIIGAYSGSKDELPLGAAMNKGLTIRTGQQHGQKYVRPLLAAIAKRRVDPSYLVTHRLPLESAADGFRMVEARPEPCTKVLLSP